MNTKLNLKYNFLTYLFLLIALFVLVIFTKDSFYEIRALNNSIKDVEEKIELQDNKLSELRELKSNILSGNLPDVGLEKYLIEFREDELTKYFYDFANSNNGVGISSINLSKGNVNDFGFKEGTINLNLNFANKQAMLDTLNFVLDSEKYNLFIHSFSFPYEETGSFSANIPLKVLYK